MKPQAMDIAAGAAAGSVATGVMSLLMLAAKKAGLMGKMPPKKITEWVLGKISPLLRRAEIAKPAALAAHFGYGAATGALYGLVPRPSPTTGALYGVVVWAASYLGWVPAMRILPPPTRDRRDRQVIMLIAHVVFGATLGTLVSASRRA